MGEYSGNIKPPPHIRQTPQSTMNSRNIQHLTNSLDPLSLPSNQHRALHPRQLQLGRRNSLRPKLVFQPNNPHTIQRAIIPFDARPEQTYFVGGGGFCEQKGYVAVGGAAEPFEAFDGVGFIC